MKYIHICITLFLLAICLYSCTADDGILERNNEPLDEKYQNFQQVNENYQSENFEVKLLYKSLVSSAASPNPIRVFSSVNNQLIIDCDAEKNDATQGDTEYFKINKNGKVESRLYLNNRDYYPHFIDDFMVFTNYDEAYFTTWPLNGDTTKRNFKVLNADLKWTGDKINHTIKSAQKDGKYWFLKNVNGDGNFYQQFLFYQDKEWKMLWLKLPAYQSIDDSEDGSRYRNDVFYPGNEQPFVPQKLNYLYFQPLEKVNYSHSIGGGSPSYSETNWRGKAFFSITIGNKPFNFYEPNIAVEREKFDGFTNRFYTIREPDASALSFTPTFYISKNGFALYASDSNEIYLINSKNK